MPNRVPLEDFEYREPAELAKRAASYYHLIKSRRTIRDFSDRPVPKQVIEDCVRAAATAPSGANLQPWHFDIVTSPAIKREIRLAAEAEEREFYQHRATEEWLRDLAPLGTDANKPFLETAPYLIAVFVQTYRILDDQSTAKCYYAVESVGIAVGFLIAGLHTAGLATLTHTPSPMGFLNTILGRPKNERPFVLIVAGYPHPDATVPNLGKKPFSEIANFHD